MTCGVTCQRGCFASCGLISLKSTVFTFENDGAAIGDEQVYASRRTVWEDCSELSARFVRPQNGEVEVPVGDWHQFNPRQRLFLRRPIPRVGPRGYAACVELGGRWLTSGLSGAQFPRRTLFPAAPVPRVSRFRNGDCKTEFPGPDVCSARWPGIGSPTAQPRDPDAFPAARSRPLSKADSWDCSMALRVNTADREPASRNNPVWRPLPRRKTCPAMRLPRPTRCNSVRPALRSRCLRVERDDPPEHWL